MNEKDLHDRKRDILKKLTFDEDDVVNKLDKLVELSIPFLKFNAKTGEIKILKEKKLNYKDKIYILLLGKYFVFQFGLIDNFNLNRQQIKDELDIPESTGISGQIKNLTDNNFIKKQIEIII